MLIRTRPATSVDTPRGRIGQLTRRFFGEDIPLGMICKGTAMFPKRAPQLMQLLADHGIRTARRRGYRDALTLGPRTIRPLAMEYAIPAGRLGDALDHLMRVAHDHRHSAPLHLPVNIRWTRADSGAWLSPSDGRHSCYLDLAWHPAVSGGYRVLSEIERVMLLLDGRPHWGKLGFENPARRFPGFERWARTRERLDPGGLFLNDHLRRLLEGKPLLDQSCAYH
jgi:L-gulono-1,4-lactone dehydrogenase